MTLWGWKGLFVNVIFFVAAPVLVSYKAGWGDSGVL